MIRYTKLPSGSLAFFGSGVCKVIIPLENLPPRRLTVSSLEATMRALRVCLVLGVRSSSFALRISQTEA